MASIKDLFIKSITEGMKAADMIPDASAKATAYANLAQALALTGQVKNDKGVEADSKEALKPETSKGGRKKTAKKEVAPVVEDVEEVTEEEQDQIEATADEAELANGQEEDQQVVEELAQEAETQGEQIENQEFTEEWTDSSLEALSDEIAFIGMLKEQYDEDAINECVASFSEGLFNSLDDINPLNIKGFVAFMQCLIADAE